MLKCAESFRLRTLCCECIPRNVHRRWSRGACFNAAPESRNASSKSRREVHPNCADGALLRLRLCSEGGHREICRVARSERSAGAHCSHSAWRLSLRACSSLMHRCSSYGRGCHFAPGQSVAQVPIDNTRVRANVAKNSLWRQAAYCVAHW